MKWTACLTNRNMGTVEEELEKLKAS